MAATNTPATMQAYQKEVYGQVAQVIPKQTHFYNATSFSERGRTGRTFNESVFLGLENGFTFASTSAMQTLNASVAQGVEEASLQGSEVALRTAIAKKSLTTAMRQGKASYGNFMQQTLKMMKISMANMMEVLAVNGNRDIGLVNAYTDGGTGVGSFTLQAATFIPLAWIGRVGIKIDVYVGVTTTKRNAANDITVTSVPTLSTLSVGISGDNTEIDAIANGDSVYYKGARDEVNTGISEIAGLTSADSYAGISCASYPDLWTATQRTSVGGLTRDKFEEGFTDCAMKGGEGDHISLITPTKWKDIADDHRGDRRVDYSYNPKKGQFGSKSYELHTLTGKANLVASLATRQSEIVSFPVGEVMRIGSADMEWNGVAQGDPEAWAIRTHGTLDVEFHLYCDQAVYTTDVKSHVLHSGIT